jgi:cytochrome c oxidase accessory protein FixG
MRRIQNWRWLAVAVQTVVVVGLPFVYVNGESALRFDIPTMKLLLFGTRLWVGEMYVVLLASLIFFVLIIAFTLVLGRVWCGWSCPQTVIGEYVGLLRSRLKPRKKDAAIYKLFKKAAFHVSLALMCALISANLIWYFVSPYEMLPELFTWSLGPITRYFFIVMAVAFYAHFEFLGQRFCATVCPYSKWQSVLLDKNSLIIAFDASRADECMGCDRCMTECPTGVDIKKGMQVECINCAKCIDVCREMTARRGRKAIVGYVFGSRGATLRDALTPKFWLFACVVAVLSGMLMYHFATREQLAVQVVKDRQALYHIGADKSVVNSYKAYITNRGPDEAVYTIEAGGIPGIKILTTGGTIHAGPGDRVIVPFDVAAPPGSGHGAVRIKVKVTEPDTQESVEQVAGFIFP